MRVSWRLLAKRARDTSILYHDYLRLTTRGGHGGEGLALYGGIGGSGGSIVMRAQRTADFRALCARYAPNATLSAEAGERAAKHHLIGAPGASIVLNVPLGVECIDTTTRMLIARCTQPDCDYVISRGGDGGNSSNKYRGQKGESTRVAIHVKLATNVGLVGLPNAGKSTLLGALVPAKRIKIADYAFTTLYPQQLKLDYTAASAGSSSDDDDEARDPYDTFSLSVADLPGIIEGASRNRGRGYAFLKHLEYSDIIVVVVDIHGFKLSNEPANPFRNALESVAILTSEMERYDKAMLKKALVLVFNKTDIGDGEALAQSLMARVADGTWLADINEELRPKARVNFSAVLSMSAKSGDVAQFKIVLRTLYDKLFPLESIDEDDEAKSDKFML